MNMSKEKSRHSVSLLSFYIGRLTANSLGSPPFRIVFRKQQLHNQPIDRNILYIHSPPTSPQNLYFEPDASIIEPRSIS
jgi:hypothetical protein